MPIQTDVQTSHRRPPGPRIAIVGGGPGGLMTAYELQRLAGRPVSVTIFEAADRVGGKIATPLFDARPVRYEAGAAEFYDYEHLGHDPLKDLVRELGLPIMAMGGATVCVGDRLIGNREDVREVLGPEAEAALLAWDRAARDLMTPAEFYGSDEPRPDPGDRLAVGGFEALLERIGDESARSFVAAQIHSDLATEPACTSADYGLQNYLMNDAAYMRLYGIVGGNQRLPEALAERLDAEIRLGSRVVSVAAGPGRGFEVTNRRKGLTAVEPFDVVVVALPHDAVPSVRLEPVRLASAAREHWDHHHHPAHYLRITMLFDRPFWRSAMPDSFCMIDAFGGCCLYDESSRTVDLEEGVLGWLLGGDAARKACDLDDATLVAEALAGLPESLARNDLDPLDVRVHRWANAVNALPGGTAAWPIDRRHRPAATHPDFHMVGDYLYDSTLNGVHDSATHVASCIAADLAADRWNHAR